MELEGDWGPPEPVRGDVGESEFGGSGGTNCEVMGMDESKPIIVSDPKVMMGKPIVAGTRITVELILEKLAAGRTQEELLDSYPQLTPESVRAALAFAAKALRADVIYPIAG